DLLNRQIQLIYSSFEIISFFNGFLIFFILGFVCDKYIKVSNYFLLLGSIILLIVLGIVLEIYMSNLYYFHYLSLSNTLISIGVFLLFSNFLVFKPNKVIISISKASFGIYLLHMFFVNIFAKLNLIKDDNYIFFIIFTFLLSWGGVVFISKFK